MKLIELTSLAGSKFLLNAYYILKIESNYQTQNAVIYLCDGKSIDVSESYKEVLDMLI